MRRCLELRPALLCALAVTAHVVLASETAATAPVIESAKVVDGALRLVVANRGDAPIGGIEVGVATRAAGRLVGSARHAIDPLAPGDTREERLPLRIWGEHRPDLRSAIERDCCTTRVWLEPGGQVREIDHPLATPVTAPPPPE